jgi:hypothetical protein
MPKLAPDRKWPKAKPDRVPFAGDTKILAEFAEALRQEANAADMSAIEYCLLAASEKMRRTGRQLSGLFEVDDLRGEGL